MPVRWSPKKTKLHVLKSQGCFLICDFDSYACAVATIPTAFMQNTQTEISYAFSSYKFNLLQIVF